jgi:hypothetical protein
MELAASFNTFLYYMRRPPPSRCRQHVVPVGVIASDAAMQTTSLLLASETCSRARHRETATALRPHLDVVTISSYAGAVAGEGPFSDRDVSAVRMLRVITQRPLLAPLVHLVA